jgi:hypothetical protein
MGNEDGIYDAPAADRISGTPVLQRSASDSPAANQGLEFG